MGDRRAGILLHPTSLPEAGDLAASAARFLAWAQAAGISVWQTLPLGPAGPSGSPYDAASAFAGDPRWFSADDPGGGDEEAFAEANRDWLVDWCLFAALKERFGGRAWLDWDEPLKRRERSALAAAEGELADDIARHRRAQLAFARGWERIRGEARDRGIAILGDVPIYPALDSADVWAHPELFQLDGDLRPLAVAGVPPDYFSATGQLWGNPVYRWDRMAEDGYAWWIARLRHQLAFHDLLRLDHFRGFAAYWAVPAGEPTAVGGAWEPGPGRALFEAARAALGGLPFVAEDLGLITDDVKDLRSALGLPGMRVLQFGFDDPESDHAPHNLPRDVLLYTGTHDNDTARGWFASLDDEARATVLAYVGGTGEEFAWSLVREAFTSVADLAVVPLQDLLDLGSEARMNVPGVAHGHWEWRAPAAAFDPALAERIARLARISGRTRP